MKLKVLTYEASYGLVPLRLIGEFPVDPEDAGPGLEVAFLSIKTGRVILGNGSYRVKIAVRVPLGHQITI